MPAVTVKALKSTLCQHDFNGRRIFQHRVGDKWSLEKENERIWGFQYEADCREFLRELKVTWFGKAEKPLRFESNKCSQKANELAQEIMDTVYRYERVGFDSRRMTFNYDGLVGQGAGACEAYWDLKEKHGKMALLLSSKTELICELGRNEFGTWEGKWLRFERMPVRLTPVRNTVSELSRNEKRRNSRRKPQFILVSDDSGDFLSKCAVETYSILSSMGFDVRFATQKSVNSNKSVSQTKKSKISPSEWNLLFHLPTRNIITSQRTVWVTSWNSLHLSTEMANSLNTADGILVPSEWNATCFSCASVIKPIGVAAPGIDTEIFRYAPMNVEGPCVFGIIEREAGLANHSTAKKMIDLFLTTFPKQNGVILKLICPQTTLTVSDPRIEIMRDHITDKKLAHWLRDITCLISIDQLEGWPTLRF